MELPVHRGRKFERETNQGLQDSAVSDNQDVLVVVFLAKFIQHGLNTNRQPFESLAVGRGVFEDVGFPRRERFGVFGFDLVVGQAFPIAKVDFTQAWVGMNLCRANYFCGFGGALQIAGVDGVELLSGESFRESLRLLASRFIERDVALTLKALGEIPVGLSVADEEDFHGVKGLD